MPQTNASRRSAPPSPAARSRASTIARCLGMVLVLGALIMTGAIAAEGQRAATLAGGLATSTASYLVGSGEVVVTVRSCPDDLAVTTFSDYDLACLSETGAYGVPLGMDTSGDDRSTSFQYTNPENLATLSWYDVAPGIVTISEVAPRIRESVVFCRIGSPEGFDPTADRSATVVVDGQAQIIFGAGEVIVCNWYRFPGGVEAGTDGAIQGLAQASSASPSGEDGSDEDNASPGDDVAPSEGGDAAAGSDDETGGSSGGTVEIRKWVCAPDYGQAVWASDDDTESADADADASDDPVAGDEPADADAFPVAYDGDPGTDRATLLDACGLADRAFGFTLSDDSSDFEQGGSIGGDSEQTGWGGLEAGDYAIAEDLPDGYEAPLVYCQRTVEGRRTLRADISEIPASDGLITTTLGEQDILTCDWFNVLPGGEAADVEVTDLLGGALPERGATIQIAKWLCAPVGGEPVLTASSDDDPNANDSDAAADPSDGDQGDSDGDEPTDTAPSTDSGVPAGLTRDALLDACPYATSGFEFTVSGDGIVERESVYGGVTAQTGWGGFPDGTYTVTEELTDESEAPIVFCQTTGGGDDDESVAMTGSTVVIPLSGDEIVSCDWFNIAPGAIAGLNGSDDRDGGGDGDEVSSSIEVSVFACPDGADLFTAALGGDCVEPVDGVAFITEGPDDTSSEGVSGDLRPGAVLFSGLEAGGYSLTSSNRPAAGVVFCDGMNLLFQNGIVDLEVPVNTDVRCDWFVPGDGNEASEEPSSSDESAEPSDAGVETVDPTADADGDGLYDADEVPDIYGTDPANPDSDGDGLVDGEEVFYGTNPLTSDTDLDLLIDGEEVYSFETDPLSADSDGDGFIDGDEVSAGTDPLDFDSTPGG